MMHKENKFTSTNITTSAPRQKLMQPFKNPGEEVPELVLPPRADHKDCIFSPGFRGIKIVPADSFKLCNSNGSEFPSLNTPRNKLTLS